MDALFEIDLQLPAARGGAAEDPYCDLKWASFEPCREWKRKTILTVFSLHKVDGACQLHARQRGERFILFSVPGRP